MTLNVVLPEELTRFVESRVASGRYASAGEVVEEALRLLERYGSDEAERPEWLRRSWAEGEASGDTGEIDIAALKDEARRRRAARA